MKKLVATLVMLLAGALAQAGELVDVQIIDRTTGQKLETWSHRGQLWVAGTPGNRYAVKIRNRGGGRVLAVLSVDGVNAISGQTASTSQSGYVLGTHQSTEVAGWRKNLDQVAAFYFTRLDDSYAARTGRPDNVGVIGVAVFREYRPPRPPVWIERGAEADSADYRAGAPAAAPRMESSKSRQAGEQIGTGHGERIDSQVGTTEFRRATDSPAEVIAIYYDSRANLIARGIIPPPPRHHRPQAFPGGFVPDPRD